MIRPCLNSKNNFQHDLFRKVKWKKQVEMVQFNSNMFFYFKFSKKIHVEIITFNSNIIWHSIYIWKNKLRLQSGYLTCFSFWNSEKISCYNQNKISDMCPPLRTECFMGFFCYCRNFGHKKTPVLNWCFNRNYYKCTPVIFYLVATILQLSCSRAMGND